MANREVKLYMPEEVYKALEDSYETAGERSANMLAIEVIKRCLPIYLEAAGAFDAVLNDYRELVRERAADRLEQSKVLRQKKK